MKILTACELPRRGLFWTCIFSSCVWILSTWSLPVAQAAESLTPPATIPSTTPATAPASTPAIPATIPATIPAIPSIPATTPATTPLTAPATTPATPATTPATPTTPATAGTTPATSSVPAAEPFSAVVVAGAALVRINPEAKSPEVGLLREGAVVTVTRCEPNCAAKEAWAILGSDGAIRLSLLRRVPGAINPAPVPAPVAEVLTYGRVGPGGITIYKAANLHSPVLTRRRGTREIVFRPNPALRARGWLERVEGGFVLAKWVTTLKPSTLKGEAQPHLPLAFVTRALATAPTPGISAHRLHRYDRLPLLGLDGPRIATTSGSVPRRDVRIVKLQAPPPGIPAGARWVHVDLKEQTLTAYEGENPVFATLISSGKVNAKGKAETATLPGLYQVEHKLIYSNMNGQRDDPYAVDRVPHVQYFHKGDALHGAYWHDGFGAVASHGCINLSLADAAWLFAWAPPRLPEAWSSVEASEPGLQTLWVFVDPKAPMPPVAVNNAAPPPPVGVSQPSRPQRLVADRQ